MANFSAPGVGTINRAPSSNPFSLLFRSVIGMFIGIALILFLAPVVLWFAESQNNAKIFSHSKEVASTSGATGYIWTTDTAKAATPLECYNKKVPGNCLYYAYTLEELKYTVKDYCGVLQENQQVVETKGKQCRRDSNDEEVCEQCYTVNETNWNIVAGETKFPSFTVGSFHVDNAEYARAILGTEIYDQQIDNTHREHMVYLKDPIQLLVAGHSDGTTLSQVKKDYLFISSQNYQQTYDSLLSADKLIGWILRIVTFVILAVGYFLLFGPISVMSNYVRKIPVIGSWIDGAVGFIILLVSILLAVVHFILLWILIILLKNIVTIAIVVAVALCLFFLISHFRKN